MIYVHFSGQSGGSTGLKNEHKSLTKLTFCLNKKLNFVNDFLKNIAVLQILIPGSILQAVIYYVPYYGIQIPYYGI